jgi:hypothetical protein
MLNSDKISNVEIASSIEGEMFNFTKINCIKLTVYKDRLCGLVVREPSNRSSDPGFDSRYYHIS